MLLEAHPGAWQKAISTKKKSVKLGNGTVFFRAQYTHLLGHLIFSLVCCCMPWSAAVRFFFWGFYHISG